jgi:hypothetical protein
MDIKLRTDNKPNLERLLRENQPLAREVIQAFTELMEEAVENKWHDLPRAFTQGKIKFTFADLVKGVLHGALDLPDINTQGYDALKEEVHPLSMMVVRHKSIGEVTYADWRDHYGLDGSAQMNQETVATIFRKMLRYYKWLDVYSLGQAIVNNQTVAWRGLGDRNIENLPFVPALRYQKRNFGELHVGRFFDDVGFFDCGNWTGETENCPACNRPDIRDIGHYQVCLACNAGFEKDVDA